MDLVAILSTDVLPYKNNRPDFYHTASDNGWSDMNTMAQVTHIGFFLWICVPEVSVVSFHWQKGDRHVRYMETKSLLEQIKAFLTICQTVI
jgi:hypothetical protein